MLAGEKSMTGIRRIDEPCGMDPVPLGETDQ